MLFTDKLAKCLAALAALLCIHQGASATGCEGEDFQRKVRGQEQCLAMRAYGAQAPDTLLVWLHGDVSAGGPANYHFPLAQRAAEAMTNRQVLSIALLRPGYPDGEGNASTVAFAHTGRRDHYSRTNLVEVATAIERLRSHYKPRQTVLVGHSGGAATAAVILGMRPTLLDGAILVACPCDLVAWRAGKTAWTGSENPLQWTHAVSQTARVIALTGDKDDNTPPNLAQAYVQALQVRQVPAVFRLLSNQTHNGAFRSDAVFQAIEDLL